MGLGAPKVAVNQDEDIDISKLRYGKIILMTDADIDGSHIRTLLLTFYYNHYKRIIKKEETVYLPSSLFKVKRETKKHIYRMS